MTNLKAYIPEFLHNLREYNIIFNILDKYIENYKEKIREYENNLYVDTSREFGLSMVEKMLEILPDRASETFDFRRRRVLNRYRLHFPFTEIWLREQLDFLLGSDNYVLAFDYNNYIVNLEVSILSTSILKEFREMINTVKPCNLVFKITEIVSEEIMIEDIHQIYFADKYLKFDIKLEDPFATWGGAINI